MMNGQRSLNRKERSRLIVIAVKEAADLIAAHRTLVESKSRNFTSLQHNGASMRFWQRMAEKS